MFIFNSYLKHSASIKYYIKINYSTIDQRNEKGTTSFNFNSVNHCRASFLGKNFPNKKFIGHSVAGVYLDYIWRGGVWNLNPS